MTTNPKHKLAACPFCGALARMERDENIFAHQHYPNYPGQTHGFRVECAGSCHSMTCWWHTEDEATEAWNRRVEASPAIPSGEQIELETSAEGRLLLVEAMNAGLTPGILNDGVIRKLVSDIDTLLAENRRLRSEPIPSLETPEERR